MIHLSFTLGQWSSHVNCLTGCCWTAVELSQAIKVSIRMTDCLLLAPLLYCCVSVQHILCCGLDMQWRLFPRALRASRLTRGESQLIGREWKCPLVWCPLTFRGHKEKARANRGHGGPGGTSVWLGDICCGWRWQVYPGDLPQKPVRMSSEIWPTGGCPPIFSKSWCSSFGRLLLFQPKKKHRWP